LIHYTIGQRRHLGLSGMSEPWYVIGLDNKRNRVKVGPQSFLHKDRLTATKVNWVSIQPTSAATRAEIKIRLGHNPVPGTLRILPNGSVEAVFDTPQMSITSGQYAVFYDGNILLGGGTIA
jgi:tRNA-specific 2-thiouridylase